MPISSGSTFRAPIETVAPPALAIEHQDAADRLAVAFLLGYSSHTRSAYEADLRDFGSWCVEHEVEVLGALRVHVDLYARSLEAQGRARSTIARRLATLS